MKRAAALLMAVVLTAALFAACSGGQAPQPTQAPARTEEPELTPRPIPDLDSGDRYTYRTSVSKLPTCWSAQAADSDAGARIASLLFPPLVHMAPDDLQTGSFQWAFDLAETVTDVTALYWDETVRCGSDLGGEPPETLTYGYVYEITLRRGLKWQNGEDLTADDFIGSLKRLLDPDGYSSLAAQLCSEAAAPAGAQRYYLSKRGDSFVPAASLGLRSCLEAYGQGERIAVNMWAAAGLENALDESGSPCPEWADADDETAYPGPDGASVSAAGIFSEYAADPASSGLEACMAVRIPNPGEGASFEDSVGCRAIDERRFIYVCGRRASMDEVLHALSRPFLLYLPAFDSAGEADENGAPAGYCTGVDNTVSCGPYMLESFEQGRGLTLTRNPLWYGWEEQDDGSALAYTDHLICGEHLRRFMATRITVELMTHETAKTAFDAGVLCEFVPASSELREYTEDLFRTQTNGVFLLAVNSDPAALSRMEAGGSEYARLLSDADFRRALSLCLDRSAWCAELGGSAALGLIGENSLISPFEPASLYRRTLAAKIALCGLYGVSFGEGASYATPEDAYSTLTGFDRIAARELFDSAAQRFIEQGLYRRGAEVHMRVAFPQDTVNSDETRMLALLTAAVNSAAEGTALGRVTFEGVRPTEGSLGAVTSGECALGLFVFDSSDPFSCMRLLCDEELYGETLIQDPNGQMLTLSAEGRDISMTWQQWSRAFTEGPLADASDELRLAALAAFERALLKRFCCIPIAAKYDNVALSRKVGFLTYDSSPFYGRGGFELMTFSYSDEQWEKP